MRFALGAAARWRWLSPFRRGHPPAHRPRPLRAAPRGTSSSCCRSWPTMPASRTSPARCRPRARPSTVATSRWRCSRGALAPPLGPGSCRRVPASGGRPARRRQPHAHVRAGDDFGRRSRAGILHSAGAVPDCGAGPVHRSARQQRGRRARPRSGCRRDCAASPTGSSASTPSALSPSPGGPRRRSATAGPVGPALPPPSQSPATRAPPARPAAVRRGIGSTGFTPQQYLSAYGYSPLRAAGLAGKGERVALIEIDGFKYSDILTYARCFGLDVPRLSTFFVGSSRRAGAGRGDDPRPRGPRFGRARLSTRSRSTRTAATLRTSPARWRCP